MTVREILSSQRQFFATGATLDLKQRKAMLKALRTEIRKREKEICAALCRDLHKSEFEARTTETGIILDEVSAMIRKLPLYASVKKVATSMLNFPSKGRICPEPLGNVLIFSAWNYPFQLAMMPLIGAVAAGNRVILKPAEQAEHTAKILEVIIRKVFKEEHVAVFNGGIDVAVRLLREKFDAIFYTGGTEGGKAVMRAAAEFLTPVTLELGGKSPCIVDQTADIKLAAKRIVFGKYLNCGQTCVAPDYVYCHRSVKDKLIKEVQKQIRRQYGKQPLHNFDYGKIINEKHFDRILGLIDEKKVVHGGGSDRSTLRIEPTVMDNVSFSDAVMQEEIFGPVMPVLTFDSLDEAVRRINSMPHPLALYLFTSDKKSAGKVTARCGFGGGCINDTIIHLATSEMGFGGFGESGMGAYHGKTGFDTFTHYKSIVDKKTWIDLPMRYQPYRKRNEKMVRFFLK